MLDVLIDRTIGKRHQVRIRDLCNLRDKIASLDNYNLEVRWLQPE